MESFSFFVDYEGDENIKEKDFNKRIGDYYGNRTSRSVAFSESRNSLITFFLQLSRYLQQSIGTVAAIDFQAYSNSFCVKIDKEI